MSDAVRKDLQGGFDHGDSGRKMDLLHQGQQKGDEGKKGDDNEIGAVGRGGIQAVLCDMLHKPEDMLF